MSWSCDALNRGLREGSKGIFMYSAQKLMFLLVTENLHLNSKVYSSNSLWCGSLCEMFCSSNIHKKQSTLLCKCMDQGNVKGVTTFKLFPGKKKKNFIFSLLDRT